MRFPSALFLLLACEREAAGVPEALHAGPANGTQTGDINWHGSDTSFTDCWFTGDAGFRIYAAGTNLSFIRPRIKSAGFGEWYPPHLPSKNAGLTVKCPMRLDGTALTNIEGASCP